MPAGKLDPAGSNPVESGDKSPELTPQGQVLAQRVPASIPPDADTDEWSQAVMVVFVLARKHDHTIPSHWLDLMKSMLSAAPAPEPERKPMTDNAVIALVRECGLDWHKGFVPLFDDDPTNRFAVLVRAVEAFHSIK